MERTGAVIRETAAWEGLKRAPLLELWRFRHGRSALWNWTDETLEMQNREVSEQGFPRHVEDTDAEK